MKLRNHLKSLLLGLVILLIVLAASYLLPFFSPAERPSNASIENIPAYSGSPYVEINNNQPAFTEEELSAQAYESYAPLDSLGRVGTAMAMVGTDLMPKEERGSISQVKPTGWRQADYDFVEGGKLYNRCVRLYRYW